MRRIDLELEFVMRGRILRVRPGHLANFSGGAGYAIFFMYLSIPIAFILTMIASVTLYIAYRRGRVTYYSPAYGYRPPTDGVLNYASPAPASAIVIARRYRIILIVVAVVGTIAAVLLSIGAINAIKRMEFQYICEALFCAASPFLAAGAAFWFQYFLSRRWGVGWWHLIVSPILFMALLVMFTLLMVLLAG